MQVWLQLLLKNFKLIISCNWDSSSLDNYACKHNRVSSSGLSFSPKTFDVAVRKKVAFCIRSHNVIVHIFIMGTISRLATVKDVRPRPRDKISKYS